MEPIDPAAPTRFHLPHQPRWGTAGDLTPIKARMDGLGIDAIIAIGGEGTLAAADGSGTPA